MSQELAKDAHLCIRREKPSVSQKSKRPTDTQHMEAPKFKTIQVAQNVGIGETRNSATKGKLLDRGPQIRDTSIENLLFSQPDTVTVLVFVGAKLMESWHFLCPVRGDRESNGRISQLLGNCRSQGTHRQKCGMSVSGDTEQLQKPCSLGAFPLERRKAITPYIEII